MAVIPGRETGPVVQPELQPPERGIEQVPAIAQAAVQTGSATEICHRAAAIAVLAAVQVQVHGQAAAAAGPAWAAGAAARAAVGAEALAAALAADAAAAEGGNRHGSHNT